MHATANLGSTLREVVALFDDEDKLDDVVEELQIVGFDRADITVLPPWKRVEKKIGRELRTVNELAGVPDAPRTVPVDKGSWGIAQGACIAGPLYLSSCGATIAFAAGGAAPSMIAMAGIAAGAMGAALGLFPVIWLRRWHRQYIKDLLDRGGMVLWVHIPDERREKTAKTILARYAARDVRCHPIAA